MLVGLPINVTAGMRLWQRGFGGGLSPTRPLLRIERARLDGARLCQTCRAAPNE